MTFLTPWSALAVAAAALPLLLLLYVLRLRRQQLRIPSTLLWQKSFEDLQANVPFQRLRWSILLLLQLLMVLLLLLALAQPMIHGDSNAATRLVLLIDHSASMSAAVSDQQSAISQQPSEIITRLDEAKRLAREMLNAMGRGDRARQIMIIAFAATPSIITTYESNRAVLLDAIDSIEQTDEPADLQAALDLAGAYSGGSATDNATGETDSGNDMTEVVLLSDGGVSEGRTNGTFTLRAGAFRFVNVVPSDQRSAVSDQQSAGSDQSDSGAKPQVPDPPGRAADRQSLNAPINNLGITSFSIRRNIDDPARVDVFARLINAGPAPVTTTLTIFVNGEVVTTLRRTIPAATADAPGEDVLLQPIDLTSDALLTLRHNHRDDLPSDDVASLVVPAPAPPRLALVHPNDRPADAFLNDLLTALEPGELRVLTADAFANLDVAAIDAGTLFDLIVLDRVTLPRLPRVATISFGTDVRLNPADQTPSSVGEVAIQPTPNRQSSIDNRQSTASRIVSWDRQHPLMRSVSLDTIVYAGFDGFLTLPSGANILAHGIHGPVMVEWQAGHVRHAAVGFELTKSNWPLHVSSAIFMQNAVDVLTPARLSAMGVSYHAGEPITVRALPNITSIAIRALPHADSVTANNIAASAPIDGPAPTDGIAPVQSGRWHRPPDITIPISPGELVTLPALRRAGLFAVDGAAVPNDRVAVNVLSETESDIRPRESLMVNAEQTTARSGSAAMAQPLWPWLVMAAFALLVIEWLVYCRKATGM